MSGSKPKEKWTIGQVIKFLRKHPEMTLKIDKEDPVYRQFIAGREAKMNETEKAFYVGCAAILGYIARERGGSDSAMKELGITIENLEDAGVEEFDLDPIKRELRLYREDKP